MNQLDIGSIVRLKSGGPQMVVIDLVPSGWCHSRNAEGKETQVYHLAWIAIDGSPRELRVPAAALILAD